MSGSRYPIGAAHHPLRQRVLLGGPPLGTPYRHLTARRPDLANRDSLVRQNITGISGVNGLYQ